MELIPSLAAQIGQKENPEMVEKVAFFFGAGASIAAGVPDTSNFVKDFVADCEPKKREIVQRVIDILTLWAQEQRPLRVVDIELLLEALERLSNTSQDIIWPFFEGQKAVLADCNAADLLVDLRDYIKKRVIVEIAKIKYLDPLRGFIDKYNSVDIYSANYDTCVELFCSENKLNYRDGFDDAWNPEVFKNADIDIRLFKVHGSVTWFRSDRGRFLKIPIMTVKNTVELITKEQASGLMLYPAQKFEYVEPLFELLMLMKQGLLSCHILCVVGYSFRDDHIRRIFWDAARKNKDLRIVLISPSSWEIYQKRLKLYDDGKTLSSLAGKVYCLPFLFEKILPLLITQFLPIINASKTLMKNLSADEIAGHQVRWIDCLQPTAKSGDIEALKTIFEKIKLSELETIGFEKSFESVIDGLFFAAGSKDTDSKSYFWQKLKEIFSLFPGRIVLQVNFGPKPSLSLIVNTNRDISLYSIARITQDHFRNIINRKQWLLEPDLLNSLSSFMRELSETLNIWMTGTTTFDIYKKARPDCPPLLQIPTSITIETALNEDERKSRISRDVLMTELNTINRLMQKYDSDFVG